MSKLNPQNATAYVGPGVLRKGGKITPVPNGPLIKKKGPFKGSTLKSGGKIKKAVNGVTTTTQTTEPVKKPTWQRMTQAQRSAKKAELGPEDFKIYKDSISADATNRRVKSTGLSAEQLAANDLELKEKMAKKKDAVDEGSLKNNPNKKSKSNTVSGSGILGKLNPFKPGCIYTTEDKSGQKKKNGGPIKKAKSGAMIKRADGSMSKRGLWDNIRANKGSGKKPTKQMLVQEKKIKAKTKK
jgi:hypothetical protein